MSTATIPMSLRQARATAFEMVEALRPYCHRVEVAGSVRRGRDWINDIEIVAIPKATIEPAPTDLFGLLHMACPSPHERELTTKGLAQWIKP